MGHCVPDWHGEFDSVFKRVDMPTAFKQADMAMSKQGFASSKEMASAGLDPLSDFGDLAGWQEHGGMIECTKGLWSEHMDSDGIAPELRMGPLEEEMNQQEQQGNSALAAQQAKEAHDEMESWLQYPADESMDTDYCGEGFGNLPAQPVAVQAFKDSFASGLTTTRFVRPNPFGPQPAQTGGQTLVRAANSAAALAEGAARVSGLLPSSLPEALSRVRTQAQSTSWAAVPASTGPPVSTRSMPASERGAPVASQGRGVSMASPTPPPRQQVYPSIFDRSRVAAAATRVGAGTKLKAKEPKKTAQLKPERNGTPAEQPKGGLPVPGATEGAHSKDGKQGSAGLQNGQNSGDSQNQGGLQSPAGAPNQRSEQSLPSPKSMLSDGKGRAASNPLQRAGSGSGELSVGQPERHPPPAHRFGGDKSLEERQKELQAELVQKQAEASAHLQRQQQLMRDQQQRHDMQRWGRGQISPVQLPPDRPRTGFKQIQPKPAEGALYELGRGFPCYPPQSFMQQHALAAEAMRSGRQSTDAGPSGQEGSVVLSSLSQERTYGPAPGATHVPSVRAPAWAALMQRGPVPPSPVVAPRGGRVGKERSSTGSRALPDAPKASTLTGGRDSVNETTVTSSYSEGDSLATSRAYQQNPLQVGRKRERCAKSDTEALEEDNDTLTEGTWVTGETEGRAAVKAGGKDKGKRSRAAEVHNQSERRRRDRINDRMRALQELIPNSNKTDKASVLDEAIEYLKNLQTQLQFMSMRSGLFAPSLPPGAPHPPTPPGMPGFSLPPMHPPSAHLPPMPSMHPPLGMPPMPFLDHPMFSPNPMMPHEEGAEMKPGRPYGDSGHEMYNAQERQREAGPFHPRLDLYEGYQGHGHPAQQPSPRFDQGSRQ